VPENVISHIDKIYNIRTKEERVFSHFKVVCVKSRMPNRGKEDFLIFINLNAITQGLTALTVTKSEKLILLNHLPISVINIQLNPL